MKSEEKVCESNEKKIDGVCVDMGGGNWVYAKATIQTPSGTEKAITQTEKTKSKELVRQEITEIAEREPGFIKRITVRSYSDKPSWL